MELALVRRLEQAETATVDALVDALLRTGSTDPTPVAVPLGRGLLVTTGPQRYVNRAVGITLDELTPEDVAGVVHHYEAAGLPAAVQLSSWAPAATTAALGAAGFVPGWCRSVLAVDPRAVPPPDPAAVPAGVTVRPVGDDAGAARHARDVMAAGGLADGADRTTSDEFMAADRVAVGTTQLVAYLDGRPVGCGSLVVVEADGSRTGWLGAAATVPAARRRGAQTALVHSRLRLAARAGCDLLGVTAAVGSTSSRVLQRCGFGLVQEQWVVQRG